MSPTNNTEDLENFWKEKAAEELNETDSSKREGIEELRRLIRERKLKTLEQEAFLLRFLRARKYNAEKAYKLLENYTAIRTKEIDLFSVREGLKDVEQFGDGWQCVLQGKDKNGRAIFVFRPGKYKLVSEKRKSADGEGITVEQSFRVNFLSLEYILLDPRNQIAGMMAIVDMTGFSIVKHSPFLSPYHSMRTSTVVQDTLPIRFGGFHVVNQPRFIDAIYALFRPFLKDKIKERIHFHGSSLEALQEYIDPDVLPPELGGSGPTIKTGEWKARLKANAQKIFEFDPSDIQ